MLVDTHCHIHDSEFVNKFEFTPQEVLQRAKEAGISRLICVGTSLKSSLEAQEFADSNGGCYFSVALHPHEAEKLTEEEIRKQVALLLKQTNTNSQKLVAVGECGLDYFYHTDEKVQKKQKLLFRLHIEMALKLDLPLIFHVRDAFDDFFSIIDEYSGIRGVVHSFSATKDELKGVIDRDLYVGLNGIMTFTSDSKQLEAAKLVPIDKLVLETDSPYLTPKPLRGKINEPKHVILITQFLSELRGESQAFLAKQTTENAKNLFNL
jgi:TatD DNase family protein